MSQKRDQESLSTLHYPTVNDYYSRCSGPNDWWGGHPVAGILLKVFCEQFQPTRFVLEQEGEIVGFLIGSVCAPCGGQGARVTGRGSPGRGREPWYLLINGPVETEEHAWDIACSSISCWKSEEQFRSAC